MTAGQHIPQDDLALYALQALSLEESAAVREHLSECAACRAELAMLEVDLATVALSVDQHPLPAGARERFARRIAEDGAESVPSDIPAHVNVPEAAFSASAAEPVATEPVADEPLSIEPKRRSSAATWIGWLAAAALLIVAVGLGLQANRMRALLAQSDSKIADLQAGQSRAEQALELLTAPTAQRVVLTAPKAPAVPTGRATYLPSRGALIFQANNLASVPDGKTYELWVIPANGSAPIPAGLFRPDAAGNGSVVLPSIPTGVDAKAFGVTMEDAAGSSTPTAPILLAGAVPTAGE